MSLERLPSVLAKQRIGTRCFTAPGKKLAVVSRVYRAINGLRCL